MNNFSQFCNSYQSKIRGEHLAIGAVQEAAGGLLDQIASDSIQTNPENKETESCGIIYEQDKAILKAEFNHSHYGSEGSRSLQLKADLELQPSS